MNSAHKPQALFISTGRSLVGPLAEELRELGQIPVRERPGGVECDADLETVYRILIGSRMAHRVILMLLDTQAADGDALYRVARSLDWAALFGVDDTFAVDFTGGNDAVRHTHYGALRIKDAVVDVFTAREGRRPDVDAHRPGIRIHAHLHGDRLRLGLDLSGEGLHRRGYRLESGPAPLRETLAAALLWRCGWPRRAAQGEAFHDPMCGSGTLPIEAAMMAGDIAPGLLRPEFGAPAWRGHDAVLWARLLDEARERAVIGRERIPLIVGCDISDAVLRTARENARRAGLADVLVFEQGEVESAQRPELLRGVERGLIVVNPPYGERLEARDAPGREAVLAQYQRLGQSLVSRFSGWEAGVLAPDEACGHALGLRAHRVHAFQNGPLDVLLLRIALEDTALRLPSTPATKARRMLETARRQELAQTDGAQALANRLRKNRRVLGRWAAREGVFCYRLYDADMPEYAVAVDLYRDDAPGAPLWVNVQEYAPPPSIDPEAARQRLLEALAAIQSVLEVPDAQIFLRVRARQKGQSQYNRLGEAADFHVVREGAGRLWVNFTDYLDTGLFLDHRLTRARVGELSAGKDMLNLFCYTGSATVQAALCGARSTTSVDMSRTYLDWAARNLQLNGLRVGREHRLIQADCLSWLDEQAGGKGERFDVIFLDPPTFSTSKRMQGTLDVQRDHVHLIRHCLRLLRPSGVLIFSTNHHRFRLEADALADLSIEDLTRATLPKDFERHPRMHQTFRIALT